MVIAFLLIMTFCRVAIGLVFAISSISKMRDIAQFKLTVRDFHILPSTISGTVAVLFVGSEFAVVLLALLDGMFLFGSFILAIVLLLLFCIALISVLSRRVALSCNCFGTSNTPVSYADVWRNAAFILCALVGCATFFLIRNSTEALGTLEWIVTALGTVVFVLVFIQLGEIVKLFQKY